MTKDEVTTLATDPKARVMVFVDGQNVYKRCKELFGHAMVNPRLLALYLAGARTANPVSCRYYTGRPNPNVAGETIKARNVDRRLAAIHKTGVTVVHRPLRYHWDWGWRWSGKTLPRAEKDAKPQKVTLKPWQRPHEKGIDVVMALDVIEFVLTDMCDVAIIVSFDRDLQEIPGALSKLKNSINRPYRIEAAVPVTGNEPRPKTLPGFNRTHQITPEVFARVRDDTDYTVKDEDWTPPNLPTEFP